jgi:hypothetical protein
MATEGAVAILAAVTTLLGGDHERLSPLGIGSATTSCSR